jgi:hypothetical protein
MITIGNCLNKGKYHKLHRKIVQNPSENHTTLFKITSELCFNISQRAL